MPRSTLVLSLVFSVFAFSVQAYVFQDSPTVALRCPSASQNRCDLLSRTRVLLHKESLEPDATAVGLKAELLYSLSQFRKIQRTEADSTAPIEFGVQGGELNATTRAPQTVDYFAINPKLGQAAEHIRSLCEQLAQHSPCAEPTRYLGDRKLGAAGPLQGAWRLLFTTAADATFDDKNSTRGEARVQNVVDTARGRITNIVDFGTRADGSVPALQQLQVVIRAIAAGPSRVELQFRYAKLALTKFFFVPLFGRKLNLYIPVPGPFITRCIVFFGRIFRRRGKAVKKVPKAYFDVLYLDHQLRIHKTGEGNFFVQARESWAEVRPLLQ